jgi:hypothetical protein
MSSSWNTSTTFTVAPGMTGQATAPGANAVGHTMSEFEAAAGLLSLRSPAPHIADATHAPLNPSISLGEYTAWKASGVTKYSQYLESKGGQMDVDTEATTQLEKKEKPVRKYEVGIEEYLAEEKAKKERAVQGRRKG